MSENIGKYLADGLEALSVQGVCEKQLTRPESNEDITVAHDSPEYHVAFPGLCVTGDGELLCVFRQGLTHAGSSGEDGRLVAIKSAEKMAGWWPSSLPMRASPGRSRGS